jgi:hypothetical protein
MIMKLVYLFLLSFWLQNATSRVYHVEISSEENAPPLSILVQESLLAPPPPNFTLQTFNAVPPERVLYLIDERATGNLKAIMDNHPLWGPSRLQQFIVIVYDDNITKETIQNSLNNDPFVVNAFEVKPEDLLLSSVKQGFPAFERQSQEQTPKSTKILNAVGTNIQTAWELSEGMGYIGLIDSGVQLDHPDLRAFDNVGNYMGGNLLDGFYKIDTAETQYDPVTGDPVFVDLNIDELEPVPAIGGLTDCEGLDGNPNNGMTVSSFVGHGTHTAGLIGAKGNQAPGICKNCGISMMKYFSAKLGNCFVLTNPNDPNHTETYLFATVSGQSFINGLNFSSNIGLGVLNFSGGGHQFTPSVCINSPSAPTCLAIRALDKNEIMYVASAGNDRDTLNFPASDPKVVAVGGLTEGNVNYWNDTPNGTNFLDFNGTSNCAQYPESTLIPLVTQLFLGNECGSNYSYPDVGHKTDIMMQAKNVYSTIYQGQIWSPLLPNECSDSFDGVPNDGYGLCSGTSMSAPQVSAIYQLMRSAHPLLPNGTSDPYHLLGLRNVLNSTTSKLNGQTGFNDYFGYGTPNPRKALEIILGKSNGVQMKTRLTPMFDVVATNQSNNVYSAFPQTTVAFLLASGIGYIPNTDVALVNEFTEFWYDDNLDNPDPDAVPLDLAAPRAEFYVFTTNNNPFAGTKNMVSLRRMEKSVADNRNDTYAVSDAEIQSFHDDGYNYAGIEGYILPKCAPTPSCVPTGATALYRDEADNLNHKLIPTNTAPPNSTLLGYTYLNQDTDGDGLIDGQEIILGTNINNPDTDGDSVLDGVEYPPAGVPYSDPRISDIIFENGFGL